MSGSGQKYSTISGKYAALSRKACNSAGNKKDVYHLEDCIIRTYKPEFDCIVHYCICCEKELQRQRIQYDDNESDEYNTDLLDNWRKNY
jgi:hypothetical protein